MVMNPFFMVAIVLVFMIGVVYLTFFYKPKYSVDVKQGGRPSSILRDYNDLGGDSKVQSYTPINEDRCMIIFENGISKQIWKKDLEPLDKFQAFLGNDSPIWILKNTMEEKEKIINGESLQSKQTEKAERERDFEHGRNKYLEANWQKEIDRRIEDIRKIESSKQQKQEIKTSS